MNAVEKRGTRCLNNAARDAQASISGEGEKFIRWVAFWLIASPHIQLWSPSLSLDDNHSGVRPCDESCASATIFADFLPHQALALY
jgi:hypothetical protein